MAAPQRSLRSRALAGVVIGLACAAAVLASAALLQWRERRGGGNPLASLEAKLYDWRLVATAEPSTARPDLVLVEIDEYSLRNLQPNAGRWPWPRAVHSMLIDYLARAPAKVVAYDVDFAEPDTRTGFAFGGDTWSGAESDQAFVDSVRRAGNVIMLADATYEGAAPADATSTLGGFAVRSPLVAERSTIFRPFPALASASAGFGHNVFMLDVDGPLRHTIPLVQAGGRALPSLGLAAALRASGANVADVAVADQSLRVGEQTMPTTLRFVRTAQGVRPMQWGLVNFRGPALLPDLEHRPYRKFAFFDLLYSEEQLLAGERPNVDPAQFANAVVFVGVTASGLHDVFETSFAGGKMPGIQVHAAVADDWLSGRFLAPAPTRTRVALVMFVAVCAGLLAAFLPVWWATLATVVGSVGVVALSLWCFRRGLWLDLVQPQLSAALALFSGAGYQYVVEGREKRKMKKLFGRYVSKDVYDQLVAHPELATLGGQRRQMTVLFSDIRGFTTLTEQGQPEAVVGMLNEYFTEMVQIVFQHKGTVDKFVGDMVMALFGAPLDDADHPDHAVQAALMMIARLGELNARWAQEGRKADLDIGIGVNTGAMIAGNIGSEAIMSYTVIGDDVNLGSRLESLNKTYGTRIIISDATRRQLKGRYTMRALGEVVVKGKSAAVSIFEVTGYEGPSPLQ